MSDGSFEEQLARKDAALRRRGRLAVGALLVSNPLTLAVGLAVGFAIGSAPATRTRAEQLVLLARWRTRPAHVPTTAPCRTGRAAIAVVCFLLGLPTGAALLFLIEHRDRAQPVWLALAAAPALAAAAGVDWLIRRPAAHRAIAHHPHHTHGGRPGQGRTHRTTGNGATPHR
ncbi:hypothetical protein [Kitasatospora griseola]